MINAAGRYRRALKKQLRCNNAVKTRLLAGFDNTLHIFLEDHADPGMDDLTAAFGAPAEMASILMAQATPQEHARYQKKFLFTRILTGILVGILILCTIYIWFVKDVGVTVVEHGGIISPTTSNHTIE